MPAELQDSVGFFSTTLGNIGSAKDVSVAAQRAHNKWIQCGRNSTGSSNSSNCIRRVPFLGHEVNSLHASYTITSMDFLSCIIFIIVIFVLRVRTRQVTHQCTHGRNNVSMSDYSVVVTGMEKDTTVTDVFNHFNDLYDLSQESDWRERAAVEEAQRVTDISHLGSVKSEFIRHSWIADVVLAHPNGNTVRAYLHHAAGMLQLRAARAKYKMFSEVESSSFVAGAILSSYVCMLLFRERP